MVRWSVSSENLALASRGCSIEFISFASNAGMADRRKRLGLLWQSHALFASHRSAQSLL